MIRTVWTLAKVLVVILVVVAVIGKLPSRQVNHCTATVTGDDGTTQQVPC